MNISDLLKYTQNRLRQHNIVSFNVDALLIMCHVLKASKEKVIFNFRSESLEDSKVNEIEKLIDRRISGEPISHILGKREFYEEEFLVNSNVLDPRPDSESIVESILEIFLNLEKKLRILELGVGSGCLVLSILKKYINSNAVGVDISQKAIDVAQENAIKLGVKERINFVESDWFKDLKTSEYDLVISNPPYIRSADIELLQDEVRNFEPIKALDGGVDGLDCYKIISKDIKSFLNKDGYLFLEIGMGQENDVINIFEKIGLRFMNSKKDLAGIIRCLIFRAL